MVLQYEGLVEWTKHNQNKRKADFPGLFQLLNLDKIPENFLVSVVIKESLVRENVECSELVLKKLSRIVEGIELKSKKSCIICLGGWGGWHTGSKVKEVYNFSNVTSKKYPDLPVKLYHHFSLKIGNIIFCIGGDTTGKRNATNQVWQMDLMKDEFQWKEIASMKIGRCNMGAAIYQRSIVVAGGYDGKNCLKSAETFKMESNQWKLISSLNHSRRNHAVVESGGCLFAIGGWDGYSILSSVERLSGLDEEWESIQPMNFSRTFIAAVTCQNKIFVIGGVSTDSSTTNSVEMFDHFKQKWIEVKRMNIERWGHSACVLEDKIFVAGGINKEGKCVKEIECYDVRNDKWSIVSYTEEWAGHSAVAL